LIQVHRCRLNSDVQYVNRSYRRTGTLWDSRYKSSVVQAETYLLACQRYIELNPVRAAMVDDPAHYRWSSYRHHALGQPSTVLTPTRSTRRSALGRKNGSRRTGRCSGRNWMRPRWPTCARR
jgi:putative transposase